MRTTTLVAGLCGLMLATGILLIVNGLKRTTDTRMSTTRLDPAQTSKLVTAVIVGIAVAWASGWFVLGPAAALCVLGLPTLVRPGAAAMTGIQKAEAVEEWTRRLADLITVGVGLEQAMIGSARTAPEPIRPVVERLTARLTARWETEDALRAFADDLDDPIGDLVVAALLLGVRRRGPGIARALTALADSAAEDVATRRRIEAERARPRATARAVSLITVAVLVLGLSNRDFVAPYGDAVGQIVLAVLLSMFAGSLWWMYHLTMPARTSRILTRRVDSGAVVGGAQ